MNSTTILTSNIAQKTPHRRNCKVGVATSFCYHSALMNYKNHFLFTAALLLFISPACLAQTPFPDTPAGKQAKGWLEAFNAGDAEKHKEFLRKNAPTRLDRADREMGLRQMTGGFDVKKVEESTRTKIVTLVQERASDQLARFTLEVGSGPQHQITRLALEGIARPPEF